MLDYRPSTVAVAAVLAATHGVLTKEALESKMSSLSPSCLLDKVTCSPTIFLDHSFSHVAPYQTRLPDIVLVQEDVYPCYTMILGDPSSTATNKPTKRPAPDSIHAAAASFSVAAALNNNKRVRLDLPGTHR